MLGFCGACIGFAIILEVVLQLLIKYRYILEVGINERKNTTDLGLDWTIPLRD
jgi:hypothetical protein